jgi:Flp pilus assembly protein TadD
MDLCESYAKGLPCKNEAQQIVAYENQNIVLESRTKEALWLGNLDLAEERARRLAQRDALDSKYQGELGEVLVKRGKIAEAAQAFHAAIRLGPQDRICLVYGGTVPRSAA